VISAGHGKSQDELMRTLLLAALEAIVVEGVLWVVGRGVGGIGLSGWADGVVRYQGGSCLRHGPSHHASGASHQLGHSRQVGQHPSYFDPDDLCSAKTQWRMTIGTNKKGEGPGVGSAQHRSRSLARGGTGHTLKGRHSVSMRLRCASCACCISPGGCSSMNGCPSSFGSVPESPVGLRSKREKLRRKL